MKIINLPRGYGKTTRLLYASEFNNIPILCANDMQKKNLINMAKELLLQIPEPITVSEIALNRFEGNGARDKDILVDEATMVLQSLLDFLGVRGEIKAITLTDEEK